MIKMTRQITVFALLLSASCQRPPSAQIPIGSELQVSSSKVQVTVVDEENQPIAKASVLLGMKVGTPFEKNFLQTDDHGRVQIPSWKGPLPITIDKAGFVRRTFFSQTASDQTFTIRALPSQNRYLIKGEITGYENIKSDGKFDIGMVLPAFGRDEIFSLSLENIISSETDALKVYGKTVEIPSNVAFPKQTEYYKLLPISLNKPSYRIFSTTPGPKHVVAAHATFPTRQVLDAALNSQPFWDLTNLFKIEQGSVNEFTVTDLVTQKNLTVSQYHFSQEKMIKTPEAKADESLFAVSLSLAGSLYIPTDLKKLTPGESRTMTFGEFGSSAMVYFLTKTDDLPSQLDLHGLRYSLAFAPEATATQTRLLDLVDAPQLGASGALKVFPPSKTGFQNIALHTQLFSITASAMMVQGEEIQIPFWETFSSDWDQEISLPIWPGPQPSISHGVWAVSFLAGLEAAPENFSTGLSKTLTHMSYGQVKF